MSGAFAYAQARMQARYGERAGDAVFQSLAAIAAFRPYLERARATRLRPWLLDIGADSSQDDIEHRLHETLRSRIDEAASWIPAPWRAAVRWTQVLPKLPALEHLLRGEPAPRWMLDDTDLKTPALAEEPEARRALLGHDRQTAFAAHEPDAPLLELWLAQWRRRLPRITHSAARRLEQLVALVRVHRTAFAAPLAGAPLPARAAWDARRHLETKLTQYFRRAFLEPAAVFAYLLLIALELERLRAALVSRRLFATEGD